MNQKLSASDLRRPDSPDPSAALLEAQKDVLVMIAGGQALPEILGALCRIVEDQAESPVRAAILLVDPTGKKLTGGAAPSLPESFSRAIDGILIDPDVGTCSAAAARRQTILTPSIAAAAGWTAFRHLPLGLGLRAAWSKPILSSAGELLGTFGTYFHDEREPSAQETRLIEVLARAAAFAIERQRSDQTLLANAVRHRESEERFRALVNASSYALYRMSPDWSQMRALDGRGFIVDTENPNQQWLDQYIYAEDRPLVLAAIQQAIQHKHIFELEHRVRRADGSLGWTLSRAVPVLDADGTILEWFGAASDVTARRQAEEALRDADRRKDEFLATLAHELRNPLAPLRNGLQIARLSSRADPALQRNLDMMDRQLSHLVRLVDDLMDIGRISAGKIELRTEIVSLAAVLASSAESLQATIERHGHVLTVDGGTQDVLVKGDFARLEQVFSNLLSNAAKYTERGGRIHLRISSEGADAVVRVTDSGIGIPVTELPRVFDLFSQVRLHQGRAEGGLGIGLALVKTLVLMHQGTVTAQSDGPGSGSTFTVRLPAVPNPPAAHAQPSSQSRATGIVKRRILVADDNVDAANSLAALLSLEGHKIEIAHNGVEAVEKARVFRPDCAILDLGMPQLDGLQAARQIRALPGGGNVLLVALTGWGQESDRQRTREAGFDRHLVKPAEPRQLQDLLRIPR